MVGGLHHSLAVTTGRFRQRTIAAVGVAALALTGVAAAPTAHADTSPATGTPATVSADALPTVQINGVVWSQVTVGNTVYATGSFTQARPAGSAPGKNVTARSNLLAYTLSTGKLITTFNHSLNGQGRIITASPDNKTVYVGGDFTKVDGQARNHIAAFTVSSGALNTSFKPSINNRVYAIAATASAVYAGGTFTAVGAAQRLRLAAFSPTGSLLAWAPAVADAQVSAIVVSPDGTRVIVGGRFSMVNNTSARGLVALDPAPGTGSTNEPWVAANNIWYTSDASGSSGITSLHTDGKYIYGTAYVYCSQECGSLEGAFAADPDTGTIVWVDDCHGDTYDSYTNTAGVMYVLGHPHFCGNIGAYPQKVPYTLSTRRALAFDVNGSNTNRPNTEGTYTDWSGTPAPVQLDWYPDITAGTFTGQGQAAWSATGNANYLALGGEFPSVDGTAQQGLVRFAVKSLATNKQGPKAAATLTPTALSQSVGTINLRWETTWDPDNQALTYQLQRDGVTIDTVTQNSTFWQRPNLTFTDSTTGTHNYRVVVNDPSNNTVTSASTSATPLTDNPSPPDAYAGAVLGDHPTSYWRLDETSGTTGYDSVGNNDLVEQAGFGHGDPGALSGISDTGAPLSGTTTGSASSTSLDWAPDTFSVEAWFKTSTNLGGQIVGFGDETSGASSYHDRGIFMSDSGNVLFAIRRNESGTLLFSPNAYNDGQWHHVVGTLSPVGTFLYIDGVQVGQDTTSVSGQPYTGYWRVGGEDYTGFPFAPTSGYLAGSVDEVAVYPTALDLTQVQAHYTASGRTLP